MAVSCKLFPGEIEGIGGTLPSSTAYWSESDFGSCRSRELGNSFEYSVSLANSQGACRRISDSRTLDQLEYPSQA